MTDRTNIIERIVNLRQLGESTSSEAEAFNAMRAAEKLMRSYRIEEAELALAEATGEIKVEIVEEYQYGIMVGSRVRHKVQACIWNIENFCEVEVVLKTRRRFGQSEQYLHWIGDKPDVEMAQHLLVVIREAMDREYEGWKKTQQGVGRGAKGAFQTAMASRINRRLQEMGRERNEEREQAVKDAQKLLSVDEAERLGVAVSNGDIKQLTSTALIVASAAEVKKKAVASAFQERYGRSRLGTASGFSVRGGHTAYEAGAAAAGRVNLGRPVGGASAPRLTA